MNRVNLHLELCKCIIANISYWNIKDLMPLLNCSNLVKFEQKLASVELLLKRNGLTNHHILKQTNKVLVSVVAAIELCKLADLRLFSVQESLEYFLRQSVISTKSDLSNPNKPLNNETEKSSKHIDKTGFVYLVENENTDLCKIGYSKDVFRRVTQLQTANPLKVVILYRYFSIDALKLEAELHKYYEENKVRGEWFKLTNLQKNNFLAVASKLDKNIEILEALPTSVEELKFLKSFTHENKPKANNEKRFKKIKPKINNEKLLKTFEQLNSVKPSPELDKPGKRIQSRLTRKGISVKLQKIRDQLALYPEIDNTIESVVQDYFEQLMRYPISQNSQKIYPLLSNSLLNPL